jgi:spore maturation protein CgeB
VRERFTRRLVRAARVGSVGLTVVCHDFLTPGDVARLKDATGGLVAMWFPDHIARFGRAYFLNADYDALFFKDPYIVWSLQRNLDRPIYYLPECFNPARHRLDVLSDEDRRVFGCEIATAGNLHSYRAACFARLGDYDVKLWGNPPPLWLKDESLMTMVRHRYVVNEDKARAFLAAKIVVNNLQPSEIWGLNARAFEAAGIGAFQLVDWVPGLAQLFEDGVEIVSFRSYEDLIEKVDHYLENQAEREAIARQGRERALRDHTFEIRLRLLRETIFGTAQGFAMPRIEMVCRDG